MDTKFKFGLAHLDHEEPNVEKCKTHIPYLEMVKERTVLGGGNSNNILIESDNYPALLALQDAYNGKVGAIIIDPPYGLEKDFTYPDKWFSDEDPYRHSRWLSFMDRRLKLARELMTEDGMIFINIDDAHNPHLRLKCDEIFGERNFMANMIWDQRNSKGNVNGFATTHEYILVYAKNKDCLPKLIVPKENAVAMIDKAKELFANNTLDDANKKFRAWVNKSTLTGGEKAYSKIDTNGRVYQGVSLGAPVKNDNSCYDLLHPNGKVVAMPSNGWRNKKESMDDLVKNGHIDFGSDETTIPRRKYYLDENVCQAPTTIYASASNGIDDLPKGIEFDYPKPVSLIKYLLSIAPNTNIVLDFFAGSGTTMAGVLSKNAEDGKSRQCILITNNDNNICSNRTYPRCKAIIEGFETRKGKQIPPTNGNLYYFKQEFIPANTDRDQNIHDMSYHITANTQIANNAFTTVKQTKSYDVYENDDTYVALLHNTRQKTLDAVAKYTDKTIRVYQANKVKRVDNDLEERLTEAGLSNFTVHSAVDNYIKHYIWMTNRLKRV